MRGIVIAKLLGLALLVLYLVVGLIHPEGEASVLIAKFASLCGTLGANFAI